MTSSRRAKALERVHTLLQRGLQDPATEESRTCAVLALRIIKEHSFLVVDPTPPKKSTTLLSDALRDMANSTGVSVSGDWDTGVICKQCHMAIMRAHAYIYLDGIGAFHATCAKLYFAALARDKMKDSE